MHTLEVLISCMCVCCLKPTTQINRKRNLGRNFNEFVTMILKSNSEMEHVELEQK